MMELLLASNIGQNSFESLFNAYSNVNTATNRHAVYNMDSEVIEPLYIDLSNPSREIQEEALSEGRDGGNEDEDGEAAIAAAREYRNRKWDHNRPGVRRWRFSTGYRE